MAAKKKVLIKIALLAIFATISLMAFPPKLSLLAKASKNMPSKFTLDDESGKHSPYFGDQGKVPFDHDKHIAKEEKCVTCHHTNSDTLSKAVEEEVRKCSDCHRNEPSTCDLDDVSKTKPCKGKKDVRTAKEAYHGDNSILGCIGCHRDRIKKSPTNCADCPTSCANCHTNEDAE
jgi:hypothetical protein